VGLSEFEQERLVTDALVYEGQQHWLHYRHIEQERNQFLGYFFTLLVAIVGFFVAFSARAPDWPTLAMGLTAMAAVLGMISTLILASVRKFGAALSMHDRDIARIRSSLFAALGSDRTHLTSGERGSSMRMQPVILHRVFDPQFAAEFIVGAAAVVSFGVQLFVAADAFVDDAFSTGQRVLAGALAAASIAAGGVATWLWVRHAGR
jgi:hypothetical protein